MNSAHKIKETSAKFIFDIDMGNNPKSPCHKVEKEMALLVDEAYQKGYQEGLLKGKQDENIKQLQAQSLAINNLTQQSIKIIENYDILEREFLKTSVDISKTIGKKIASNLLAKYPETELDALIKECLNSIEDAPHLVIRCHPDLVDISQKTAQEHMKTSGFSGRLVILGDDEIELGDGKIEWVDGGLIRSSKNINEQIENAINNFLNANNISTKEENKLTQTNIKESDK